MKYIAPILFVLCLNAQAQVFKSPADAKVSAANIDSMLFMPNYGHLIKVGYKLASGGLSTANKDSMVFIPANGVSIPQAIYADTADLHIDTIPKKPVWKTTISSDRIVSAQLLLTKSDGSIIVIDSAWKMNVRKEQDKVAVIYPDSSRVLYRVVDQQLAGNVITIPFEINKKTFDNAKTIKLEIIR